MHGPFNFAMVNNRKTRDRIIKQDWQVLAGFCQLFQNPIPSFDVPTYLVHVDNGVHVVFCDKLDAAKLLTQHPLRPRDDTLDSNSPLFSDGEP